MGGRARVLDDVVQNPEPYYQIEKIIRVAQILGIHLLKLCQHSILAGGILSNFDSLRGKIKSPDIGALQSKIYSQSARTASVIQHIHSLNVCQLFEGFGSRISPI